ncbi:hypothetical protein Tco_0424841 [Tanacetum coccineum]
MANLSKDIQCAGSDTRPPMLDRTDFASWQQRIRLYCRGTEGDLHLGPERPRVYSDLSPEDKERMQLNSKFVNNMLLEWGRFVTAVKLNRGLRDSNYDQLVVVQNVQGRQNRGQGNNAQGAGTVGYGGALNRVGNANLGQARQVKQDVTDASSREWGTLDEEQLLFIAGGQGNTIDKDVDEQPVQDLSLNVDNVFQADDCDAFDSDVDEAPMAQTMFMANLSSTYPVYDKVGPSYDLDILSEVYNHGHYQDVVCKHHEEHEMHDNV